MNNSVQRLNLFKVLQAREHIKFQNIQQEKMVALQVKIDEEMDNVRPP